ncbi:unnamed protein product [Menidia menidia]|uniref:(Atlantic silverside) hypothetical protein n=1 Tax=Menidia menidia TaxID=238744 RepID=A0A8S4BQ43_9TELE|nr:unnamed protein product [Menidia menidia]
MGYPFFLLVMLNICSFGSLLQTSFALGIFDTVQTTHTTGGTITGLDNAESEVIFHTDGSEDGSGLNPSSVASPQSETLKKLEQETKENYHGPGFKLITEPALVEHHTEAHNQGADKANASITGYSQSTVVSEEALLEGSQMISEEELQSHASTMKYDPQTRGNSAKLTIQTNVFPLMTNHYLMGPGEPCVLGDPPCAVFNNVNGTSLLWDDMKRTLAFAWELHVYGSASLFTLMAVLALLGIAGACTLPHPLCDILALSNILLIVGGAFRAGLLLLDPYGTRQILPHVTLAALHNLPLQLLLWTQIALALVTMRGIQLLVFPLKLEHPWVVGWVVLSHCTALVAADLYSSTFSPVVPLLLQTLSLCWGIPFCLLILTKSFSDPHPLHRSSVPQWVPSKRTERLGKRVIAVCAFLGLLCCSLQMYSLFWLYGLLGNWRQFGWGWWLSQFWARILELAWGFSLLFLGSWIFWTPSKGHARGDHGQSGGEESKSVEEKSFWRKLKAAVLKGPLRKSEKSWEALIPNNWAKYKLSKEGINNNAMYPCNDEPDPIAKEYFSDPISSGSADSQSALLWQKVGERECVLSLVEFDIGPPSPINLRRSIDNALYHGQLVAGGLFTPPPPTWNMHTDGDTGATTFRPGYVGYRWNLDTESISTSLDHFQAKEPAQSLDCNSLTGSLAAARKGEEFSVVMHQHDWSDDDITDL